MKRVGSINYKAAESTLSEYECFPVMRRCKPLPLVIIKSATPLPASAAPPQHPVAVTISTLMDLSTNSHLSSKPQYPKILVTIMYKFIAELCLIVGNAALQTCTDLFTCDDPLSLQVWHRLDPAGHETQSTSYLKCG